MNDLDKHIVEYMGVDKYIQVIKSKKYLDSLMGIRKLNRDEAETEIDDILNRIKEDK